MGYHIPLIFSMIESRYFLKRLFILTCNFLYDTQTWLFIRKGIRNYGMYMTILVWYTILDNIVQIWTICILLYWTNMWTIIHTQLFDNFVSCNSQAKYYTKCFKNLYYRDEWKQLKRTIPYLEYHFYFWEPNKSIPDHNVI